MRRAGNVGGEVKSRSAVGKICHRRSVDIGKERSKPRSSIPLIQQPNKLNCDATYLSKLQVHETHTPLIPTTDPLIPLPMLQWPRCPIIAPSLRELHLLRLQLKAIQHRRVAAQRMQRLGRHVAEESIVRGGKVGSTGCRRFAQLHCRLRLAGADDQAVCGLLTSSWARTGGALHVARSAEACWVPFHR